MATLIPCSVDTTPMAAELKNVSNHVKGTTDAVITMQTAVIAAENNGANKVCSNVNKGFFSLMRSQISQKIANKQSRVEALIMQLGQQKRQLLSIKTNMEREYGRITERYLKIFTSVNKELDSRIYQIDQPVFEFVNKHMMKSSNRMNALSGWVTTSQAEGITQSQQIMVSKMKHDAQVALEQSTKFLSQIGEQRVLTGKVLISDPMDNKSKTCKIPVAIWETLNDNSGIPRTEVSTPEALAKIHSNQINNVIREAETLPWGEERPPMVVEEFMSIVDSSASSPRIKDTIKKMFTSSDYETI